VLAEVPHLKPLWLPVWQLPFLEQGEVPVELKMVL
jgi:hypothetical protein